MRVNAYDLDHQLCENQSDPHPVEYINESPSQLLKELTEYFDNQENPQPESPNSGLPFDMLDPVAFWDWFYSIYEDIKRRLAERDEFIEGIGVDDQERVEGLDEPDLWDEALDEIDEALEDASADDRQVAEERSNEWAESIGRVTESILEAGKRLQSGGLTEERAAERVKQFEDFVESAEGINIGKGLFGRDVDRRTPWLNRRRLARNPEVLKEANELVRDLLEDTTLIDELDLQAGVDQLAEQLEFEAVDERLQEFGADEDTARRWKQFDEEDFEAYDKFKEQHDKRKADARRLLDRLRDGTITPEELSKLRGHIPGKSPALDEYIRRKGWINDSDLKDLIDGPSYNEPVTSASICSHDAPCDSPSRTVTLTVVPGEHNVLVTAVNSNNQPVATASSKFAVDETTNEVSSQGQLVAALQKFSTVKIVGNFDVTQTIQVPSDARIIGVNNPVIRTNTTAFSVKESNVELAGFTITKLGSTPTGVGVLVDRPKRSSTTAPSNINIHDIVFLEVGTPGLAGYSPIVVKGYNKLLPDPDSDSKIATLNKGSDPIKNIKIEFNRFVNIPNNAIDVSVVNRIDVADNNIFNTNSSARSLFKVAILESESGSGVVISGKQSSSIDVTNNIINNFGINKGDGFNAGVEITGSSGVKVSGNTITGGSNIWNSGISSNKGSSNLSITDNNVDKVRDGILLTDNSNTFNVRDNKLTNINRYGIQTYQTWSGAVNNNKITQSPTAVESFNALSKLQQRTLGLGSGVLVGESNGIQVVSNKIEGVYEEKNGDSAVLISGIYPIQDTSKTSVQIAIGEKESDVYGDNKVTDSSPQNIVAGNTHLGPGKLFSTNKGNVILVTEVTENENINVPSIATSTTPVLPTSTTPEPYLGGITTTTTTTTTDYPGKVTVIASPNTKQTQESLRTEFDTFVTENKELVSNNNVVIITPNKLDSSKGSITTSDDSTKYKGDTDTTFDTDPVVPGNTTTTTSTTPPPFTIDRIDLRTQEEIARDNYIAASLEANDAFQIIISEIEAGLIDFEEAASRSALVQSEFDVDAKKEIYENVRYTEALWKRDLSTWLSTRNASPCTKERYKTFVNLMPQDWSNQDLYWANDTIIDISGITKPGPHYDPDIGFKDNLKSVESGGVGVRKAAVLISPSHVLMADHWKYTEGQTLTWVANDGEEISRKIVSKGIKVPGADTRVLGLDEPVPDKLKIYPLPSPKSSDTYNDLLNGSLVFIGNQQRKFITGYILRQEPSYTYDPILNVGLDQSFPSIRNRNISLKFQSAIPFLNQQIPTSFTNFQPDERPSSIAAEGPELNRVVKGDSGSPSFILSPDGDIILISQHQFGGGTPKGPFFGSSTTFNFIQEYMNEISDRENLPRYTLRSIDPCTGEKIGYPGDTGTPGTTDPPGTTTTTTTSTSTSTSTTVPPTGPPTTSTTTPRLGWTTTTSTSTGYPTIFTNPPIIDTPRVFDPPNRIWTPPPWITTPPPEEPYIPALCRTPPEDPPGEEDPPEEEDTGGYTEPSDTNFVARVDSSDDVSIRVNVNQESNEPIIKIFPAPVSSLQEPFNPEFDFNTNVTKRTPTPYNFTTPDDEDGIREPVVEQVRSEGEDEDICPPDQENCNTLQF